MLKTSHTPLLYTLQACTHRSTVPPAANSPHLQAILVEAPLDAAAGGNARHVLPRVREGLHDFVAPLESHPVHDGHVENASQELVERLPICNREMRVLKARLLHDMHVRERAAHGRGHAPQAHISSQPNASTAAWCNQLL